MGCRRAATGAAGRRRDGPRQTLTTGDLLEGKSAMALCGEKSGAESGPPTLPENLGGNSAMVARVWKETDLGGPTGTQTQLQPAKNPPLHYRLYAYPSKPKAREETSPLRLLWLGGHSSVGGGTAPRGRWTEDGMLLSECA